MTTEAIFQKYAMALVDIGADTLKLSGDAVLLALRLAIADAHDAGLQTCSGMVDDLAAITASQDKALQAALDQVDQLRRERNGQPDQRRYELLVAQIERLNEWLATHARAHYRATTDTATAILDVIQDLQAVIAELKSLPDPDQEDLGSARRELTALIAERDGLRQQLTQMDADNGDLRNRVQQAQREIDRLTSENGIAVATFNSLREPTPATNGNGASPAADEPLSTATWYQHLDDETNDWRLSIEAGRRTFRQVPKAQRLLLAQAVARHVGGGKLPKQTDFDLGKPHWMPGAGGLVSGFAVAWSELLTVTTFEVAP